MNSSRSQSIFPHAARAAWGVLTILVLGGALTVSSLGQTLNTQDSLNPLAKVTGTVQVPWNGGQGGAGSSQQEKLAFADLAAFVSAPGVPPKGEFSYLVIKPDLTLHRQITAEWLYTEIDLETRSAWLLGSVVFDTKGEAGGGTHSGGCSGGCSGEDGTTHDDGGCSGSDGTTHDEGGCSGSDGTTHDEGGCSGSDGTTHDDGGCSGSDGTTHDDGGCSGSGDTGHDSSCSDGCGGEDDPTHDDGGCSGGGDTGHTGGCSGGCSGSGGGGVSGSGSRVGQLVFVQLIDGGTPASNGDEIRWRWFAAPEDLDQLLDDVEEGYWPHLCPKAILEGNLTVHDGYNY